MRTAWGLLLSDAEKNGELRRAQQTLQRNLKSTEIGNQRMTAFGCQSSELTGDGAFLTPRMEDAAKRAVGYAEALAGDANLAQWRNGDPEAPKRLNTASSNRTAMRRSQSQPGSRPSSKAGSELSAQSRSASQLETGVTMLPPIAEPGGKWERLLGYEEHDEADFDRVWRKSISGVLGRAFQTDVRARPSAEEASSDVALDAVDEQLFELKFLHSSPGKLKARCIIRPADIRHQATSNARAKELRDPKATAQVVTQELSKSLRHEGMMLPKYGLQVTMRRVGPSIMEHEAAAAKGTPLPRHRAAIAL
jgi:hypothetical protein